MKVLEGLNQAQQQAVEFTEGPLVIVAGPGTGKTKTLVARMAYLTTRGVPPERVLALTFTRKAAAELAARVAVVAEPESRQATGPVVRTFHALCRELLDVDMRLASAAEQLELIKGLVRPSEFKGATLRELALVLSRAKNELSAVDGAVGDLVRGYDMAMTERGLSDFDDLLRRTYERLQHDEAWRMTIQGRFDYVMVDEFQDTNQLQYALLKLMCGHDRLAVIGDPHQSIYGFRGAGGDVFGAFLRDFPTAQQITLTTNYRSAPAVVRLGNAVFSDAPDLVAASDRPGQVAVMEVHSEYAEARWVLDQIQRSVGGTDMNRTVSDSAGGQRSLRDFAIIYRSRSAAVVMTRLMAESGLPYQVAGEGSPYEQPRVQAMLAWLRALANGALAEGRETLVRDEAAKATGLTPTEADQVWQVLVDSPDPRPATLAERLLSQLGWETDPELQQLLSVLSRFATPAEAVAYVDELAGQEFYDPQAEAITLLTIHAAKGLEFGWVFVIGVEEGVLPHARPGQPSDLAEEQRLFYVAVTRARDHLSLLYTRHRSNQPARLSRFAAALPVDVLPRLIDPNLAKDQRAARRQAQRRAQGSLF